jgi:hypothetical protein
LLALVITLIAQTLSIFGYWLIGQSAQINAPLKYYFLFFPIGWAISTLPINIGVVEGGLVYLSRGYHGFSEQALVLAVLSAGNHLIGSIPGVFCPLVGPSSSKEVSLEKDFLVDEPTRTDSNEIDPFCEWIFRNAAKLTGFEYE